MCRLCLPRRTVLLAPAVLPIANLDIPVEPHFRPAIPSSAAKSEVPVEPHMRLANPPPDRLTVALTLDACPGAFDTRIANALVDHRIQATIFVTALWMHRTPAALEFLQRHRDLFAIENHGARHIPPVLGDRTIYGIKVAGDLDTIRREVTDGATAITTATGLTPNWYRAATGFYSPSAIPAIEQCRSTIAGFSLNADQGASLPAGVVANRIASAGNGDVIIAHINQPDRPSGAGVVEGIQQLQRRGVGFVRLDQLAPSSLTA